MLTEADQKLIENVRHWESARSEQAMGLLSIIERQGKAIDQVKAERNEALSKAQMYENDWMQSKHEFCKTLKEYREKLTEAVKDFEFYVNGWVQKNARINYFGIIEEVWKNPAVQNDHGRRAKEAIAKIKGGNL